MIVIFFFFCIVNLIVVLVPKENRVTFFSQFVNMKQPTQTKINKTADPW